MKTPKKKQLYDVCEMLTLGVINYHISTPHFNIPASLARYYVKTLKRTEKGRWFMYVKNGLKPLNVLRERKLKAEQKKLAKLTCPYCNGQFNPHCTEQTNCLNVSMEAELTMKRLGII